MQMDQQSTEQLLCKNMKACIILKISMYFVRKLSVKWPSWVLLECLYGTAIPGQYIV